MRAVNYAFVLVNFITLLLSILILRGGIWLSGRASHSDCFKFLQWALIAIGISIVVVSVVGLVGVCNRSGFLMCLYLVVMVLGTAALLCFIVFAYIVTRKGSGRPVLYRAYSDYYLQDFSGWLRDQVVDEEHWRKISSCIRDSKVCRKLGTSFNGGPETANMFYMRNLGPIQSGCCKPLTVCGYTYVNETMWNSNGTSVGKNPDCLKWSNNQEQLCYQCDSCKAGVLGNLKKRWRKASIINIVVLILFVILTVISYLAYNNNKGLGNDKPYVKRGRQ